MEEEASARIYHPEHDTNGLVLLVQAKRDDPTKLGRILDTRNQKDAVDSNYTPLATIEELRELVVVRKCRRNINLADGDHNITIKEDLEEQSTLFIQIQYYRSCIIQQGDHNDLATMVFANSRNLQVHGF